MALVDSLARLRRKRSRANADVPRTKKRRHTADATVLASASAAKIWPFL